MQDITKLMSTVTGGLSAAKAKSILQHKFPTRHVELPREITGDGRSLRTHGGGWRGAVFFPSQAVQMIVNAAGKIHRDPMGQGDL